MPQVVSLSRSPFMKHVDFLKHCGFSLPQMKKMVVGCPQVLALNLDIMKLSFNYFQEQMGRDLDDLVEFPLSLHTLVRKKGLKCSLGWLLNCSDEKFEERMNYDSIDLEEMEMEPSFSMNSLLGPRRDEDGFSEDDDVDSEDEYA
ncbi:hypothetical protein MKW94_008108 [Papaver nudicaule]|uniref:Uncharacterized protein n=1 Tax=Papaver nudicaule TaxID=74823 RepID=A0AA41S448_PAPNU|nr:hypothetical protein [Papaver nudicaule]